jgi:hypothetical protein
LPPGTKRPQRFRRLLRRLSIDPLRAGQRSSISAQGQHIAHPPQTPPPPSALRYQHLREIAIWTLAECHEALPTSEFGQRAQRNWNPWRTLTAFALPDERGG